MAVGDERRGIYRELNQIRDDISTITGQIADIQFQNATNSSQIQALQEDRNNYVNIHSFEPVRENYVSKEEFAPIKRIFWAGMVTVFTCIVLAVLAVVLNKPPTMPLH